MGHKIFVSYKHEDAEVEALNGNSSTTARDYVEELIEIFDETDDIYKGEDDKDISGLSDDAIKKHLADKMYDSSITIVLVSNGMKEENTKEREQWIPWEVSYSLKEIDRGGRTSQTNAVIMVALPDQNGNYSYYIKENVCAHCNCRTLVRKFLFKILSKNTFNIKKPKFFTCPHHKPKTVHTGESSYIISVKWSDFINNRKKYISRAVKIKENIDDYNITKELSDDWRT